ncbi:hypothetical protein ACJRO7_034996 [Eucalyptus globulus]|uniref:SKP1 component POZ domain-containing protein n=1 Tax=Eucalyptus globulus TaxID=34317 RepID=A0ABD3JEX2_EUCGL
MSSPPSSSSSSTSPPACPKKMITLRSSDGATFEIEEAAALLSKTLESMIGENCAGTPIPLPNIAGKILAGVVEFCSKHAEAGVDAESLRAWDAEFVAVDQATLFDYIQVLNTPLGSSIPLSHSSADECTSLEHCILWLLSSS